MGVQPETVSRWENDKATMNEQAERLLRMMVAEDTSIIDTFPEEFAAPDTDAWLKAQARNGEWRAAG
jgi:transcriptional regulator with XRE-family HTH domain